MTTVYPDGSLVGILLRIVNAGVGGVTFRLYTNDVTPGSATVLGDFTEAAFTGYAAQTLDETDFVITSVSGGIGSIVANIINFLNSSGGTQQIYGYYVTDSGNTKLISATRFDSAPVNLANGSSQPVLPTLSDTWVH